MAPSCTPSTPPFFGPLIYPRDVPWSKGVFCLWMQLPCHHLLLLHKEDNMKTVLWVGPLTLSLLFST